MVFDMGLVPSCAKIKKLYTLGNGNLEKSLVKEKWYTTLIIKHVAMKEIGLIA